MWPSSRLWSSLLPPELLHPGIDAGVAGVGPVHRTEGMQAAAPLASDSPSMHAARADRPGGGHDGLPVCGVHALHHGLRRRRAGEAGPEVPRRPQGGQGAPGLGACWVLGIRVRGVPEEPFSVHISLQYRWLGLAHHCPYACRGMVVFLCRVRLGLLPAHGADAPLGFVLHRICMPEQAGKGAVDQAQTLDCDAAPNRTPGWSGCLARTAARMRTTASASVCGSTAATSLPPATATCAGASARWGSPPACTHDVAKQDAGPTLSRHGLALCAGSPLSIVGMCYTRLNHAARIWKPLDLPTTAWWRSRAGDLVHLAYFQVQQCKC